jgi:hypothetical protein
MNPSLRRLLLCLGLSCLLTSCPETTVGSDFGPAPVQLDASDWNGLYDVPGEKDTMKLEVTNAVQGEFTLTEQPSADEPADKKDKPTLITLRHASKDNKEDLRFATLRDPSEPFGTKQPLYLLRTLDDDRIVLWMIDQDAVEAAVKAGTLKGTNIKTEKDGTHCHLASDPANYVQLIQPHYWKWQQPAMLAKQKKKN